MAKVTVSDILSSPRFLAVFNAALTERNALIQSGIAAPDPDIAATIAGFTNAGRWLEDKTIDMRFVRRWVATWQPAQSNTATTTDGTVMARDIAPILRYNTAFSGEALAAEMAGFDFVTNAATQLAENVNRFQQTALFSILKGVFAANVAANGGDLVFTKAGILDKFDILNAAQLLGDAKEQLTAVAMHSATETLLTQLGMTSAVTNASDITPVRSYAGKRIIVDDRVPYDPQTGDATIYLFGSGALALNNVPRKVPFEANRIANMDADELYARIGFILHLRGVRFNVPSTMGQTPTLAELEAAANWTRVYDKKSIGCCKLDAKLHAPLS